MRNKKKHIRPWAARKTNKKIIVYTPQSKLFLGSSMHLLLYKFSWLYIIILRYVERSYTFFIMCKKLLVELTFLLFQPPVFMAFEAQHVRKVIEIIKLAKVIQLIFKHLSNKFSRHNIATKGNHFENLKMSTSD